MDDICQDSLIIRYRKIIQLVLLTQLAFFSLSNTCQAMYVPKIDWVALEGGTVNPIGPGNTTSEAMPTGYAPQPYYYDNYATTHRSTSTLLGLGFGKQFARSKLGWLRDGLFPTQRIGLFWDRISTAQISGEILQYQQSPATYQYQYSVRSNVFWLDFQSDITQRWPVIPFIDVALGSAFNTTNSYSESPLQSSPPSDSAAFADHTSAAFAWRLGVGVNYRLAIIRAHAFTIGAAYRYSDLGSAQTGASSRYATATQGLKQQLNDNEWLLTVRYNI